MKSLIPKTLTGNARVIAEAKQVGFSVERFGKDSVAVVNALASFDTVCAQQEAKIAWDDRNATRS